MGTKKLPLQTYGVLDPRVERTTIEADHTELSKRGWQLFTTEASNAEDITSVMGAIGDRLGARAVGRARAIQEVIQPVAAGQAHEIGRAHV